LGSLAKRATPLSDSRHYELTPLIPLPVILHELTPLVPPLFPYCGTSSFPSSGYAKRGACSYLL